MKVVRPYLQQDWQSVKMVASNWAQQEPNNLEAWFYLAAAEYGMHDLQNAKTHMQKASNMNRQHPEASYFLDLMNNESMKQANGVTHLPLISD